MQSNIYDGEIMNKYEKLKQITHHTEVVWKNSRGIAPDSVADKLDEAMLNWITQLTEALSIWIYKDINLTEGELILARTNLGALTECWLKFFFCVYYEDYLKNPKIDRKNQIIEPNKMSLETLKQFSIGILWDSNKDPKYKWVDKVQHQRNAIHAFNYRNIGTPREFLDDIEYLYEFVDLLILRLPPIEDCMEYY